ncbi:MAG: ECF transporter S component [Streptococcaceae bacterium]|jgi:uncharacterized membrane protein|nr:ECF transporter S component [Streptococcaceae bacterium]
MQKSKASDVALLGIFIAIMVVVQVLTQVIYAVWPAAIQPTFMQIPVIIGSITLGWKKGAVLGFFMGFYSFLYSTVFPVPTSYLFTPFQPGGNGWSLFVAFVPRILIGILPYFVYRAIKEKHVAGGLAGLVGSATNGVLVIGSIFIFFGSVYGHNFHTMIMAVMTLNTAVEWPTAIILTAAIAPVITRLRK